MTKDESQEKLPARSRKFFEEINETCLRQVDHVTIPILGFQDNEIRHDRTGILYRVADDHFVLTAAHDLHQIVQANIPLYLSMNKAGVTPLQLDEGARFHSSEEIGRDVAAIRLPPETAHEVRKHREFLSHNQIGLDGAESRGPFVVFGYPKDWSGHVVGDDFVLSQGMVFATFPYDGPRRESAHYDPNIHMLLGFQRDAINSLQGVAERLPKPYGISGCGVWQVGDIVGTNLKPRDEDSVTLVGIQHRWFAEFNYIQATKIRHALSVLVENYPKAQAAMSILYPK